LILSKVKSARLLAEQRPLSARGKSPLSDVIADAPFRTKHFPSQPERFISNFDV
jgi:hypothetical protein